MIDKKKIQLFHTGENYSIYKWMGAHPEMEAGMSGFRFTVWAPHATKVEVVLPEWGNNAKHLLEKLTYGVWSVFVPYAICGLKYYFEIFDIDNRVYHKTDPLAFYNELRPRKSSITTELFSLEKDDYAWAVRRHEFTGKSRPLNIYEVHAGTWRKHWHGSFYGYREMAKELSKYCIDNGYTHVELLPITEHPLDQSWGYQPAGFFAPTSRFGSPHEFKNFVEICHQNSIGVIIDWVPSHFCVDPHALGYFDGRACYEYDADYMTYGNRWGAHCFDIGRKEVKSFLISSALYWFELFNIDGIRVDAVSDLLDIKNRNKNNVAVDFLRALHQAVYEKFPYALMMAEDSTMRGGVTTPYDKNGLGFSHQWNMGWTFDVLSFMKRPAFARTHSIKDIAKTLDYGLNEQFVIPLSHDISKSGAIRKFPGKTKEKLEQFKLLYTYFIIHPGAKLAFMGTEWGGKDVWRMHKEITWPKSRRGSKHYSREFAKILNHLYLAEPMLWPNQSHDNVKRLNVNDNSSGILVVARRIGYEIIIAALNFSEINYQNYLVGVPLAGEYLEVCRSDEKRFGGKNTSLHSIFSQGEKYADEPNRLDISLPPLSSVVLKRKND
ncbi:MAG: 1,4-alpha-glucan branching protein GlgB [Negativicutes bacterium]|jgi:1,4-alpha-glucan branching enzyme